LLLTAAAGLLTLAACSNNPYPSADEDRKILYTSFQEAPRTLDPAVAYTTSSSVITGNVFDTLLEYHYRKRPYELIPGLARQVPEGRANADGTVNYRFELRAGVEFHEDPCFPPNAALGGRRTRHVTSADIAFQLMRIADPAINSPVRSNFSQVVGFAAFSKRLAEKRKLDPSFDGRPADAQYAEVGGIAGIRTPERNTLEIVLTHADPKILYWFAMPFTTPLPKETVAYYDGNQGRARLADHPIGTGPFILTIYEKQFRMILDRNPHWWGLADSKAPAVVLPVEGDPEDVSSGTIDKAYLGRPAPFLSRVEFRREREGIPRFNKFLQGYYDYGGIIKESFDAVIQNDRLSPLMRARGMRLDKSVEPSIFYIGFNMDDPTVGRAGGERSRKLRQAMSLVIDVKQYLELFLNGRGVPAQSLLPPGLYGYNRDYRNPFRKVDIDKARGLLKEAGYAGGIDPATGQPLRLTFDTGNTTTAGKLQYQFFINAWRQLGLDVELAATNYNQFQDKVRKGSYQIFTWGWIADYPDPENFLFLLQGAKARSNGNGPNTANFKDPDYDRLYDAMKNRTNDAERGRIIAEMLKILERRRPWIELYHREAYELSHGWLKNAKPTGLFSTPFKYLDVDATARAKSRLAWNQPVVWPAYVLLILAFAAIAPGIVTFYRERQ